MKICATYWIVEKVLVASTTGVMIDENATVSSGESKTVDEFLATEDTGSWYGKNQPHKHHNPMNSTNDENIFDWYAGQHAKRHYTSAWSKTIDRQSINFLNI